MPNVVTSLARKLRTSRTDPLADARHRRDGWFDDANIWHDAENESAALADGASTA